MRTKHFIVLLLVAAMALGIVACASNANQSSGGNKSEQTNNTVPKAEGPYTGLDISEPVTLKVYVIGDVPADMQKVQYETNNKYFKPLLNTTVEFNFLSWSDYQTKYSLILAGVEQCDLIYTATWCYFNQEASKGAFKELTMDWIKKYMPQTFESQDPDSWPHTSINGKIYAVPRNSLGIGWYRFLMIREDLREKYNLPAIRDISTLEQFLFTIAEKEKGVQAIAAAGGNPEFKNILVIQMNNLQPLDIGYDFYWHMNNKPNVPSSSDVLYLYTSDYFKSFAERMANWAAKGVWSKNAINNTVSVYDAFAQGKSAAAAWHTSLFKYGKQLEDAGIGKAGYYDITPNMNFHVADWGGDAMAIPANSKYPERAAMVLDLMKNNVGLNRLLRGGIEGVHYTLSSDGKRVAGPEATKYPWGGWAWAISMPDEPQPGDLDPR